MHCTFDNTADRMWVSSNLLSFIICLLSTLYNNVEGAELRCYNSTISIYETYSLQNPEGLLKASYYMFGRITAIVTHGFGESADDPSVTTVAGALLNKSDCNVCALDWRKEASNPAKVINYPGAVANAMIVGKECNHAMTLLIDNGLNPNTTYLIGHSLGGQMFGYCGRGLRQLLRSLIVLDGAGPGFEGVVGFEGADTTSAQSVTALHTNPGKLGSDENRATVDIYANCESSTQPGCTGGDSFDITSEQNKCSHSRSYKYYAAAYLNPDDFIARSATGCMAWEQGGGNQTISLGRDLTDNVAGLFYLQTNSQPPYGRGIAGSHYQNL